MGYKAELLKSASLYILDFIIQNYGGDKYNNIVTELKIKSILKNDEKRIKKNFILPSEKKLIDEVFPFLCKDVFPNVDFFETQNLSAEKEAKLWKLFYDKHIKYYEYLGNESKNHLIKCVNEHNNEICKRLLDQKGLFEINILERESKKQDIKYKQIIDTLQSSTNLQSADIDLDYLNLQLESIMKSMRYELEVIRYIQNRCLIYTIIIFVSLIFLPILGKYYTTSLNAIFIFSLLIILVLFAIVLIINVIDSIYQKKVIDRNTLRLFETHYTIYRKYLEKRVNNYDTNSKIENETFSEGW